jgi:hypothetical protein
MTMTKRFLAAVALGAAMIAGPAVAGEVNGSSTNPKSHFSEGNSLCIFSGLNDNPESTDPANPGGKTQSYGQENRLGLLDPSDPDQRSSFFFPGVGCNPVRLENLGSGE